MSNSKDKIPCHVQRDYMVQLLDQYEKLLREYKSTPITSIDEFTELEKKIKQQRAYIEEFQGEINSYVRLATLSNLHIYSSDTLKRELRRFERWIGRLPTDLDIPQYEQPFQFWRKFLEEACVEIRDILDERGESLPQSQKNAARVASEVQAYLETVRLLEERCEDDVKNHPNQEAEIRRRYRRAIDALKDTQ